MADFSSRLRKLRAESGLTQPQLAKKLNTTKATISNYESGRYEPGIDAIKILANLFEVSIDYLLGSADDRFLVSKNDFPPELQELINGNDVEYIRAMKKAKQQGLSPEAIKAIIDIHADISKNSNK